MVGFDFLSPLLELSAAILGFIYVYLIATEKSVGWIFGIASAFLYAMFFYRMDTWGLFSQQIAYVVLGFYGLATWSAKKEALPINTIGRKIGFWIVAGLVLGLAFYFLVSPTFWLYHSKTSTGSLGAIFRDLLDAQFFVFSLLATWLTTRKILENWQIWIVVNIVGTIWFAYEHWWSSSVLYMAYLFLAINGLKKWKKQLSA
jgi:nicotinamide mononucleotide transporter